jgi:hypothetical protein
MPEQLLDCHYIRPPFQESGCKRVSPRHAFDSGLAARQSETRLQVDKRFPGFVVIEDEPISFSESPKFQDSARFLVDRNRTDLVRFMGKYV